jgi:hypothetical protein
MSIALHSLSQVTILTAPSPSFKERLAASELLRGLRQLGHTGHTVIAELPGLPPPNGELRFVLSADRLEGETYEIASVQDSAITTVTIKGANQQALLYSVFEFLERQGAYFGVDGDLYPLDKPSGLLLPNEGHPWIGAPRFGTRGLLPWPDFLNCISVYNREDFRAYLEAMLRMRFNTLGIHVYGQRDKWVESFLSFEYGGVGHAAFTDTTATDRWGYLPQRTSRLRPERRAIFDDEVFGQRDATGATPGSGGNGAGAVARGVRLCRAARIRTGGLRTVPTSDEMRRLSAGDADRARPPDYHEGREFRFADRP